MTSEHEKEMRRLTGVILAYKRMHPLDFQVFLGALLANVVGALPDDYWARMMVTNPCEVPGCDCHVIAGQVMAALNILRNDHDKTLSNRAGNN
jgi:hypothetical protein